MPKRLIFLLGGARSGKSYYAEQWAKEQGRQVLFVATAQAFDDDMRERIAHHQASRPVNWRTLEAPLQTAALIREALQPENHDTVLLDCITLLTSNILLQLPEDTIQEDVNGAVLQEIDALIELVQQTHATWLLVSNEVGMGVVPPTRLGRQFRDVLGRANQRIAQSADEVWLLVAGIAWKLKP